MNDYKISLFYGSNISAMNHLMSLYELQNRDEYDVKIMTEDTFFKNEYLSSIDLFSSKKFFIIQDVSDKFFQKYQKLESIEDIKIVLFSTKIRANSKLLEWVNNNYRSMKLYDLTLKQRNSLVTETARALAVKLDNDTTDFISHNISCDDWIDVFRKLHILDKPPTPSLIEKFFSKSSSHDEDFLYNISAGNLVDINKLGLEDIYIIRMLFGHFKKLFLGKLFDSPDEAVRRLKIFFKSHREYTRQLELYDISLLREILLIIFESEILHKKKRIPVKECIMKIIVKINDKIKENCLDD